MEKNKDKGITGERTFVIPLRKEFLKKPKYRRAKKAVSALKDFIIRHMKVKEVKIGKYLNEKIWERGQKSPPSRVKVKSIIEDDYTRVELVDFPFEKKKEEPKKEGLKEKLLGKKEEKPETEQKKEERLEEELVEKGKVEVKETPEIEPGKKEVKAETEVMTKIKQRMPRSQKSAHEKKN